MNHKISDDGKTLVSVSKAVEVDTFITSNDLLNIGYCAFYGNHNIISVEAPAIINVGIFAFQRSTLKNINLPKAKEINSYAFDSCFLLEYINIPNCINIEKCAFSGCPKLHNINSNLSKEQLIPAFGSEEQYQQYLERRRDYKLNRLINEI